MTETRNQEENSPVYSRASCDPVTDAPLAEKTRVRTKTDVQTALLSVPFLCLCFFDKNKRCECWTQLFWQWLLSLHVVVKFKSASVTHLSRPVWLQFMYIWSLIVSSVSKWVRYFCFCRTASLHYFRVIWGSYSVKLISIFYCTPFPVTGTQSRVHGYFQLQTTAPCITWI